MNIEPSLLCLFLIVTDFHRWDGELWEMFHFYFASRTCIFFFESDSTGNMEAHGNKSEISFLWKINNPKEFVITCVLSKGTMEKMSLSWIFLNCCHFLGWMKITKLYFVNKSPKIFFNAGNIWHSLIFCLSDHQEH